MFVLKKKQHTSSQNCITTLPAIILKNFFKKLEAQAEQKQVTISESDH